MIFQLARRAFVSRADRRLQRYRHEADAILARDAEHRSLNDGELRDRAMALRRRAQGGEPLDALKIATFALLREAARRTLGQAHVPAQLIAGLALQDGCIADMKTGEGKTLAATLPCGLNALSGRGVHLATPNDYLAARDAQWMEPIYQALGLSVGLITADLDDDSRRAAYRCDVTYGVASEFGFDYLRDNMKFSAAETVQRGHAFALVDEADSVLIDDAGLPLSLYGPLGDQSGFYQAVDGIVAALQAGHTELDDRRRVTLTEAGLNQVEHALRQAGLLKPAQALHDLEAITLLHHVMQALRANFLLAEDRDYIVQDGEVSIVDKLTGRIMPGRRFDEGLHQALEAKEGLAIGEESRTLASITFQTFFSRYDKLAGMTGTAAPDEAEYRAVYDLDVVTIPPHRPLIRIDQTLLHPTEPGKLQAVLQDLEDAHQRGQPVLIGAPSIDESQKLAELLTRYGWIQSNAGDATPADLATCGGRRFAVLNARHHAQEAIIIAQAGQPGAVTIATAMAGRGTDIQLGGTPFDAAQRDRVVAAGGLLVIGTAHHELRRLDDQLRGRAGRQGDPGRSVFHASLQDDLLRRGAVRAMPHDAGDAAAARKRVAEAQAHREALGFDARCQLLRFDRIISRQRDTVYRQRAEIREGSATLALLKTLRDDTIEDLLTRFAPIRGPWDVDGLDAALRSILTLLVPIAAPGADRATDIAALRETTVAIADRWMQGKIDAVGEPAIADILRRLMLALLDQLWAEQSERLEHLKRMIGDRMLPAHKVHAEFEIEAFALFELMRKEFRHEVTAHAMRLGVNR